MWYDTLGSIILISLATLSIILVILIAVEPYLEPVEIHVEKGVITNVFISDWETYYVFNGESYNINTLYTSNIEIKLFAPCEIIYGKSVIWGREKIIALEYIEGEIPDCNTDYSINYESFSLSKLPTDGVKLITLCRNTYGESPLYAKDALIDFEYLEVE